MIDQLILKLGRVPWEVIASKAGYVLFVLVLGAVALRAARMAVSRFEARLLARDAGDPEHAKRAGTLTRLLRQIVVVSIWIVVLFTTLSELGVDMGPLLASAGIAGLAVGFGAQNLVRDVISGFFLILEDQIRVGDIAVINSTGGLVERIRLRTVVLRDYSGVVHVFPTGTITTLSNMTKDWSFYVFDLGIAYKENTDHAVDVIAKVGRELREDPTVGPSILDDVEIAGVNALADSAVVIRGRIKTTPAKQWEVGRAFLRRVKMAFDEAGIEIPFPQRSLHWGKEAQTVFDKLARCAEMRTPTEE